MVNVAHVLRKEGLLPGPVVANLFFGNVAGMQATAARGRPGRRAAAGGHAVVRGRARRLPAHRAGARRRGGRRGPGRARGRDLGRPRAHPAGHQPGAGRAGAPAARGPRAHRDEAVRAAAPGCTGDDPVPRLRPGWVRTRPRRSERRSSRCSAGPSWVGGRPVAAFERDFASYLGAGDREVVGVGNGTDALAVAFGALGLAPGDGVLVVGRRGRVRRDGSRPARAARAGGRTSGRLPVGASGAVRRASSSRTCTATPSGWTSSTPGVASRGLLLVEDCAQAHGLRVDGRHVGLVGDAATFSFYPTKNLGAVGDGGAVLLAPDAAARARALREYGWGERYRVEHHGGRNSRLDTLQAAVLSARLPFLDARNERRRAIASRYRASVELHGDPVTSVAHHAVALLDSRERRDALRDRLAGLGIMTAVHYPWLVSEMPGLTVAGGPSPVAAERRDRMLSLPCFPELTDDEVDRVCEALG